MYGAYSRQDDKERQSLGGGLLERLVPPVQMYNEPSIPISLGDAFKDRKIIQAFRDLEENIHNKVSRDSQTNDNVVQRMQDFDLLDDDIKMGFAKFYSMHPGLETAGLLIVDLSRLIQDLAANSNNIILALKNQGIDGGDSAKINMMIQTKYGGIVQSCADRVDEAGGASYLPEEKLVLLTNNSTKDMVNSRNIPDEAQGKINKQINVQHELGHHLQNQTDILKDGLTSMIRTDFKDEKKDLFSKYLVEYHNIIAHENPARINEGMEIRKHYNNGTISKTGDKFDSIKERIDKLLTVKLHKDLFQKILDILTEKNDLNATILYQLQAELIGCKSSTTQDLPK